MISYGRNNDSLRAKTQPGLTSSKTHHKCVGFGDTRTFESYIAGRMSGALRRAFEAHINECTSCWERWNMFRWDRARGTIGFEELREYLGNEFIEYYDSSWALAREWKRRNPRDANEVERFYREVPDYLYNLVIWHESGHRKPYVQAALPVLTRLGTRSILDFGCGVGNDGLQLLEAGFTVTFCDFDNQSTKFLRWRLQKRGISAEFVEPSQVSTRHDFDTVWAIDVIEHLPDLKRSLDPLLDIGRVFVFNLVLDDGAGGRHPFHILHPRNELDLLAVDHRYLRQRGSRQTHLYHMLCYSK